MRYISALVVFLFITPSVVALSLNFSGVPASIDKDQEFEVNINLECSGCKDSYLRGVFYPSGTKYFGLTQNNLGNWVGTSSDKTAYYHISESSWSGKLRVKPDFQDANYTGPGQYQFKVGRYTGGGSATWTDSVTLNIVGPAVSPIPTPTPIPKLSPTPRSFTTPTPAATLRPEAKTEVVPTPSKSEELDVSQSNIVSSLPAEKFPPVSPEVLGVKSEKTNWVAIIVMGIGLALIALAGYVIWRRNRTVATMNR